MSVHAKELSQIKAIRTSGIHLFQSLNLLAQSRRVLRGKSGQTGHIAFVVILLRLFLCQ